MAFPTPQEAQAQDEAFAKQATDARATQQAQEAAAKQPPSFLQQWTAPVGKATLSVLDGAMSMAESFFNSDAGHKARDVVSGAMTGAVNTADAVGSAVTTSGRGLAAAADPGHAAEAQRGTFPTSPIWDHAKQHIMDFRDAVAVQDPTMADNLVQGVAQLAIPFAGYSRALAGVHGIANMALAGAATDATALDPHAPRMADLISLGRHTEGKFGAALRALAPDGSALNGYINFLASDPKDGEAEARFKNVLDGFGTNLIAVPLLHAAGVVLKQGTAGLRYAIDNGVSSADALMRAAPKGGE